MPQLIFATSNPHKLKEVNELLLGTVYSVAGLKDIGFDDEIEETGSTLTENALIKARTIYKLKGGDVFSEDTGLEISALDNAPGIHTARFAGEQRNADDNMNKALMLLENQSNRQAQFRTIIALILNGEEFIFEGIIKGKIAKNKTGQQGFGYDPIFIPEGYDQSFAVLNSEIKNEISHRGRAMQKLIRFLKDRSP